MGYADKVNEYFDAQKPWELAKDPAQTRAAAATLHGVLHESHSRRRMLAPVLPMTTERSCRSFFGIDRT